MYEAKSQYSGISRGAILRCPSSLPRLLSDFRPHVLYSALGNHGGAALAPKPINNNTLFYGDNLQILREYIADESAWIFES